MKILIISNSFPFPPKNGKDLPIANIFRRINKKENIEIDILIIYTSEKDKISYQNKSRLEHPFNKVYFIKAKRRKYIQRFPWVYKSYLFEKNNVINFVQNTSYDWCWVSPYPCYGFINFCKLNGIGFLSKIAIGLNDDMAFVYENRMNKLILQNTISYKYFVFFIQSILIKLEEKRILPSIDLIHLQTHKEKERLLKVLGDDIDINKKIIVEPNGIDEKLLALEYKGVDSNRILCMTQLDGLRKDETKWFFTKSWPLIKKACPNIEILVVGAPPKISIPYLENDPQIKVMGFVENIESVYESVCMSIVPSYHNSGLINRLLESLTVGIPTISTNRAISTFSNIKIGQDILEGNTPKEFADAVVHLFNDKDKRNNLSKYGKAFAKRNNTWNRTADNVYQSMCLL